MNVTLTQAELGEAMRRLAAQEGHKPTVFKEPVPHKPRSPHIEARRARARELRSEGLPLAIILARLAREGMPTSMPTLKHALTMAP